jgi:hypothetical protein
MQSARSHLARKFAHDISQAFTSTKFREKLPPYEEQKATAPLIHRNLERFLKTESRDGALRDILFDWEGNDRREGKQKYSYPILGTSTWPDAAVLRPFKCAFEFDREKKQGTSGFKDALMKASVHVLSGAYEACVLVFILLPGLNPYEYLDDKGKHTRKLVKTLEANGLYLSFPIAVS